MLGIDLRARGGHDKKRRKLANVRPGIPLKRCEAEGPNLFHNLFSSHTEQKKKKETELHEHRSPFKRVTTAAAQKVSSSTFFFRYHPIARWLTHQLSSIPLFLSQTVGS